jgi:hypothetical protein
MYSGPSCTANVRLRCLAAIPKIRGRQWPSGTGCLSRRLLPQDDKVTRHHALWYHVPSSDSGSKRRNYVKKRKLWLPVIIVGGVVSAYSDGHEEGRMCPSEVMCEIQKWRQPDMPHQHPSNPINLQPPMTIATSSSSSSLSASSTSTSSGALLIPLR